MKKFMLAIFTLTALLMLVPDAAASRHGRNRRHHKRDNDGLALAAGIIHLVRTVVAPPRTVVVQPKPIVVQPRPVVIQPRPVVVQPPPRKHYHRKNHPKHRRH